MELTAQALADLILAGFNRHFRIFTVYNKKAARYFAKSLFQEAYQASIEQIDLYDTRVQECLDTIRATFKIDVLDEELWQAVKIAYMHKLYNHLQPELAESFYNSVFCQLFNRHYYNNDYIFLTQLFIPKIFKRATLIIVAITLLKMISLKKLKNY